MAVKSIFARFACLLLLQVTTAASRSQVQLRSNAQLSVGTRIINGEKIKKPSEDYSYFALPTATPESNQWLGCGASVISPTTVLCSAHCFGGGNEPCKGPKKVGIWIGDLDLDPDSSEITPRQGGTHARFEGTLVCNENWDGKCSHGEDIVLLRLNMPVPDWVTPVKLNLDGEAKDDVGDEVTVLGYGLMEGTRSDIVGDTSPVLRKAKVTVQGQNTAECKAIYKGGYGCSDSASEAPAKNKDQQICASTRGQLEDDEGRDSCAGDSGGPLVDANGVQVGIVSYGGGPGSVTKGPGRSCGDPNWPGIYMRISAFASFIKKKVLDLP
eukprot:TRINITY_DN8352_c0_g4_i1.p1 TRINITY_DN8352_c0_g4~~TRINITY_DN8352_c0_g4_i1.p1  ORF type:complete len:326 (-),score=62.72 TRINITY_DN8352_c0_g4_i1:529-1506(-)